MGIKLLNLPKKILLHTTNTNFYDGGDDDVHLPEFNIALNKNINNSIKTLTGKGCLKDIKSQHSQNNMISMT